MPSGRTLSRNRFFGAAKAPATISAQVTGTGFTVGAFLDRGLEDVKSFTESKILSAQGITSTITRKGTHVLEFIIAFRSTTDKTCDIACQFAGSNGQAQNLSASVTGKANDMARVSFHAPVN